MLVNAAATLIVQSFLEIDLASWEPTFAVNAAASSWSRKPWHGGWSRRAAVAASS